MADLLTSDLRTTDPAAASPATAGPATAGPAARRAVLAERIAEAGIDALLVTDLTNIRYLTGFTGSNAALLIRAAGAVDESAIFATDGRYETQSAEQLPELRRIIDRTCDRALITLAGGRVGFESNAVSYAGHRALGDAVAAPPEKIQLVPTVDLVESGRAIKDSAEIDALGRAGAVADQAFADLIAAGGVRSGRTEREIGLDLDQRMRLLGAVDPAFPTIVAAGRNSAVPHHQPTDIAAQPGDLVKLDFGAEVAGYHSDMTRTVVLGPPAGWQQEIHQLVAAAQQAGRDAIRPGASGHQVDSAARSVIEAGGHGEHFIHGLGHGIGLQIHEAPALGPDSTAIMAADMCVTVEPGIYLPDLGGVRIEDSGVVRPDGYRVLTMTTKELLVL